MKKYIALLVLAVATSACAYAQDDDVYFVPSKSVKEAEASTKALSSDYEVLPVEKRSADSWATNRRNDGWDVDAYNRRQQPADTVAAEAAAEDVEDADGVYTTRLVRFHSPRVGVYVSSPYYTVLTDYYWYDPWLSPWDYNYYYYGAWYGWGWSPFYYGGPYWHYAWHGPWWGYGWHHSWGGHWHGPSLAYRPGGDRYLNGGRRPTTYRPSRNYATSGNRYGSAVRPSRSYNNVGTTRSYGNTTRPSRNYGNTSRSSGNVGNTVRNNASNYTPSRSMGNSGRSVSAPSRSGFSTGGGRSFGGGGGRSGGRR